MKAWHLGVMFACIVLLASGSVAAVVLYVTDRADDRHERELAEAALERLAACDRGNTIRRKVTLIVGVLEEFTGAAADAREASAKAATDPADVRRDAAAAARYRALGERLSGIPEVDCSRIIEPAEGR